MDATDTGRDEIQAQSYGTEVLCSGWNPLVAAVIEPVGQVYRELLVDLAGADIDGFLRQFYRCQQI